MKTDKETRGQGDKETLAERLRATPPERILVIKPSAIGDIVHSLPILNLVRKKWPAAKISWLVTPTCAGILDGHPQIDEVIIFDRKKLGSAWRRPKMMWRLSKFMRGLKDHRFDMVIDMQGLLRSGWMSWRTGAKLRVGFGNARELGWMFYTHRVQTSWTKHAIDRYLDLAVDLGCERGPVEFVFPTTDEDRATVAAMLPDGKRFAVLLPGTNWMTKRWPVKHFAEIVKPLREKYGLETIVAGSPADSQLAEQIGGMNLCGKTNLRQLVALLERADLVIANDSGPMHIAAALGRPLVTAFGPTNADRTGPFGRMDTVIRVDIPCSPCYSRTCSHRSCLEWLKPEAVVEAAGVQLSVGGKRV
jgi:lipopolysaccharide heptosyltransferase I